MAEKNSGRMVENEKERKAEKNRERMAEKEKGKKGRI